MMKNWRTSISGYVQNISWTTALLALSSPDVQSLLASFGVGTPTLVALGAIAKVVKVTMTKDAASDKNSLQPEAK